MKEAHWQDKRNYNLGQVLARSLVEVLGCILGKFLAFLDSDLE